MNQACIAATGEAAQLSRLTHFLQQFWSSAGLPVAALNSVELALEEIFMNVVMHAAHGGTVPHVEVSLALAGDGVTLAVEDDGPPFDPLSLPAPDVHASVGERPIGGLGVYLVRQLMDAVSYQRIGARNRLSMIKRIGVA